MALVLLRCQVVWLASDFWLRRHMFIGGLMEFGESWENCAARELMEECGIEGGRNSLWKLLIFCFSFQRKTGLQHLCAILCLRKKGNTTWRSSWRQTLKMTWLQKTESHTSARAGVGVLWTRCVRWKTSFSPSKDFVKPTKRKDGISKQCWLHPAIEEVATIKIQVYYWILLQNTFCFKKSSWSGIW